jgi:hypothetical protein
MYAILRRFAVSMFNDDSCVRANSSINAAYKYLPVLYTTQKHHQSKHTQQVIQKKSLAPRLDMSSHEMLKRQFQLLHIDVGAPNQSILLWFRLTLRRKSGQQSLKQFHF